MSDLPATMNYDLKNAISANRLVGLWRLMHGFRRKYFGAVISLGVAAWQKHPPIYCCAILSITILARTTPAVSLPVIAAGICCSGGIEGGLSFQQRAAGRQDIRRHYAPPAQLPVRPHPAPVVHYHSQTATGELIQRSTSDVDAVRRFFSDQAIGFGRMILVFVINFCVLLAVQCASWPGFDRCHPDCVHHLAILLQAHHQGL